VIQEWQSVWPNRYGRIGQLQAIQWLIICLLLTVYVATYFRLSFQVIFKILTLKGFDGLSYHVLAAAVTILMYWKLKGFFERCLYVPVYVVTNGKLPPGKDEAWKLLVGMNAVCVLMPAFSILMELLRGKHNLTLTQWGRLLLLGAIGIYSFRLAVGAELTGPDKLPEGKAGSFSQLVVAVSVWSNACFLLSSSLYMPYYGTDQYVLTSIKHAGFGSLVALTLWQLKGVKWPVLLGLAFSILGGPFFGTLLSRGVGISSVFVIDYGTERNAQTALVRMWGFGLGQAAGRVIGGILGHLYIGVDGGEICATMGEALAAIIGFQMVAGSPTRRPPEAPAC
jgi:hypothetical protein